MDLGWRSLLLFSLSLPTLCAALLVATRSADRPAAFWLAALFTAWAILTTPYIIGFAGAYSVYPWLNFAPFNTELWIGPLAYFYVSALVKAPPPRLFWLVPGISQTLYYIVCFSTMTVAEKTTFNATWHEPYVVPVETLTGLALGVFGLGRAWVLARNYHTQLEQTHSAADRFDPGWVRWFAVAMAVCVSAWLLIDLSSLWLGGISYVDNYWLYLGIGAVFLWLAFEALMRIDWVFPAPQPIDQDSSLGPPNVRSESLPDASSIRQTIEQSGWHRDENLTVGKLARLMGTNQAYLSRAINAGAEENFNRFINRIRVDEVCQLLAQSDASLLELAMDAGFTSKATFNRAFKTITGKTPSQWRVAQRLKS
ncbi:MAG: hypothetical protein DHS20C11_16320 [Lysobacteraceae bacterium]|nr:MAG: hypothetical protein DHS20C11_16320 [Xanthomonadaceae bacterium]